jgi:glutamate--cysteine ligase
MRGADGGPWRRLCALPALWVGLLYDQVAQDAAWDLVKDWNEEDRRMIQSAVPKMGLAAPLPKAAGGGTMRDLAKQVLEIAREGLRSRNSLDSFGENEIHFLNALVTIVETGKTPAEELLDKFNGPWGGQVDPVFREYAY